MAYSFFDKLWNATPKMVAHRLFPGIFFKRRSLNLDINGLLNRDELQRLKALPRYTATTTQFMGGRLNLVDADSFLSMCDEIYGKRNYEFEAGRKDPLIIDCGANIGMSVLFFKTLYPAAKIIAFEADRAVFSALASNVRAFGLKDVELHNRAVWSSETELRFLAEGSWGGRIVKPGDRGAIVTVETEKLKNYLDRKIDFLKIDVEGAETEIIKDCADHLHWVNHLFLEYHSHSEEEQTLHEILSILQASGFRYHIKEASERKTPFLEKQLPALDSQLDIFAYRV